MKNFVITGNSNVLLKFKELVESGELSHIEGFKIDSIVYEVVQDNDDKKLLIPNMDVHPAYDEVINSYIDVISVLRKSNIQNDFINDVSSAVDFTSSISSCMELITNKSIHSDMLRYIIEDKNGGYKFNRKIQNIFLDRAIKVIEEVILKRKPILFVGTKQQSKAIIENYANQCSEYFVTDRWPENFISQIAEYVKMKDKNIALAKKHNHPKQESENPLRGIIDIHSQPGLIIVIDAEREKAAVNDAHDVGIPVIAMVNASSNPSAVDYLIPANANRKESIEFIISKFSKIIIETKKHYSISGVKTERELKFTS